MRLLLDTHVVLWELEGTRTVGSRTEEAMREASELFYSVVSFAEIGVKNATGKLRVHENIHELLDRGNIRVLPLTPAHGLGAGALPLHHRDPFDRMLIAQARAERLTLVSADRAFAAYDVRLLPADQ